MDSVASYDEENSDSDYVNVSSEEEISEEELEENVSIKRRNLQLTRRKDGPDLAKAPLSKLNIKQVTPQPQVKMSLKRKFSFPSASVKKENDGPSSSSISFQLISASQSPEENSSISIPTTPTMELDAINNASLLMPAPGSANDEPPYFPEKYGKLCAFCNLGERSQLGQGEMLRLEVDEEEIKTLEPMLTSSQEEDSKNGNDDIGKVAKSNSGGGLLQQLNRRQKGLNKCKNPIQTTEYIDEFDKIGHQEPVDLTQLVENGYFYVHRSCALWSFGVVRDPVNEALSGVSAVLQQSLNRKCSHCNHFGASATCKMTCQKAFHFPCIAASGSFQVFQNSTIFCGDHLGQVPLVCSEDINCVTCNGLGDVANLMMCVGCGDHYHGTCVGVAQQPGIRAGWQCKTCRSCQICRIPDTTEGRSLACENCDKLYHAQCLRPVMATIPKYGWKCRCCRVCSDCGARTPGAGASSRWHNHYTVCDSCYQQRNKGYSCPICRKAYRAAAYREMVKCSICQKFVHSTCDPDADLTAYERRKEVNPDYEYTCNLCKHATQNERLALVRRSNSGEEDSFSASQDSIDDIDMENVEIRNAKDDYGLGKGKPFVASKIAKKKLSISAAALSGQRPKGIGKVGFQKKARTFELGRKRGPKSKMRGIFGVPGLGLQRPIADSSKQIDDEPGTENRLVLCSAKDRFVLSQDICVMCGAIGTDQEGCLISCAQCGQCYHPYCVSVKVTKEILQKGWRCLDCTVCEGCGEKNDEARLILCDDCDISFHIYCMEPPLDTVPTGTWKCKWCAICYKCGANDPGPNCAWQNSYTECGPCSSQVNCPSCMEVYNDGELIIQCASCDRWLHCLCDSIKNDADAEKCAEEGYICLLCRPKDIQPPHLQMKKKLPSLSSQSSQAAKDDSFDDGDNVFSLALEGSHFIDGVYLSELGLQQIKSLQTEQKRAKRKPKVNAENEKDAAILAAIESVVAGSADNSMEEIKMELMDPNEEAQIYKDGMDWSSSDPAPDGFSLFTTETGQVVLRKKRQRNLQKLGIGGFSVRNRAVRTKEEDPPNSSQASEETKKKKPNRRKQKNKLVETYPAYLQEAFFGRSLLDSNVKVKLESSSSDEETKSNVSDDKTIKLSLDELKMIESMRAKQQQKLLEEQKLLQLNLEKTQQTLISNGSQIHLNQKMQVETVGKLKAFSGNSLNLGLPMSQPEIKTELGLLDDDENNSDTDALKDVLGLPNDLLDNDLVNTIMNEDDDLTKNSNALDEDGKGVKDDLADMLSPHFNLDCKDMEDMLFKSVMTDESQESQESMLTNSLTSYSTQSTPSHQSESQQMHLNQPTTPVSANMNSLQSPQPGIPHVHPMMGNMAISPQIMNPQMNSLNQSMMLQQPNQINMQQNIIQRQNSQPGTPGPMTPQRGYFSFDEFHQRNPFNSAPNFPNQAQWNTSSDNDFDMASTSMAAGVGNPAPKVNNHQKTAERMAEDEKLGDMSTISAVLYANQNHPELKVEFSQWPDRYKQIMKKWRALSSEKKAPYLQRARDNRSAQQAQLRTKKAQQVAPDLSPDGGTTTSTNSTSPALSSTLSESSSLMDVSIMQQQQQQQLPLQNNVTQPQLIQVDQDKITAQQKSMKEAEQERQWKALQAMRAREQQMGVPPDGRMHHMNGESCSNLPSIDHSFNNPYATVTDPNVQLQISTTLNDGSMSPVASPSPNSRNQFVAPSNKGRMMMNPQSPSSSFQHPGRPVSTQLQRQQSQNRMGQSPFSPQATTPQSPHDAFPGSPSSEQFARPTMEEQQFLHSPLTPKPVVQQQSPVHVASGSNMNFGPMTQNQNQPQQQQQPIIRPLDNMGGYVQGPGTPRPSFNPGQTRNTVYARPDMFNKPSFILGGQRNDQFSPQSPQDQNNRQLRDLLQRQQAPTNPLPVQQPNVAVPPFSMENEQMKNQQNISVAQPQQLIHQKQPGDNTFRQPLPPSRHPRMQSMVGGQMIRTTQLVNPQRMIMNPDNRPRLNIRPGTVLSPQQMLAVQQQQNQLGMQQQRMVMNPQGNFSQVQGEMLQQGQSGIIGINDQNAMITQHMGQPGQNIILQQNLQGQGNPQTLASGGNDQVPTTVNQTGPTDAEGIPDSVTAELEKLEQDENVGMDGVGDILGGLGDDEEDLLDSLTADMDADFNILEYADPELDTTDDEKTNLLDSLELDESENAKDEKLKNLEAEKLSIANVVINPQQQANLQRTHIPMTGNPNIINQIPSTVNQIDQIQNINQNPGGSQQGQQILNQVGGQQIVPNQQGGINNFQRQQYRIKTPNQIPMPEIQQIHQQMMLQLQQAAAQGKPMPLGTRLVSNNNVVGTVVGPNNIQLNFASGQQRLQQVRMVNPMQGNQNNPRMPQMPQNRPQMMQNPQQPINPMNIQGIQSPMGNQPLIGQQSQLQQQQQQNAVPPPPPYPEPPPPYPGQASSGQSQEQPLLLKDLVEQEKREQARHTGSGQMDQIMPNLNQQSILNDQDYEKLRADVLTSTTQSIPMNQMNQQQQQQQQQQPQFMPRAVINKQWRAQAPVIPTPPSTSNPDLVRSVPVYQANLQAAPPVPPENILTDADKITQANYEGWLNQQNNSLQEQLRYYETEILELRKLKKSLNTKQRQLKKNGNELTDVDSKTLLQVTQEQQTVQKHLESARKQARNHLATKQDYDAKKSAKQTANNPHMVPSPGQMSEQSPMMSPSPGGMSQNLNQQPVQSPLGNPNMAPSQSPLHSPSPMMTSQSPGPASIMQSPGAHMNAMSPYNNMQQSPRIGTPHSQIDDSPFSPNSGSIDSPSISGRLTSPAPRMTSPQHRPSTPMQMMSRMGNPGQFNQQNVVLGQQTRFVRPQQMMQGDGSNRMGMRMPGNFQQIGHNPNIIRQSQYNVMDGNQNPNQQNMQQMQQNQNMDPQMRQLQIRQMQIRQQQMMNQQQQVQQNPQMMQQMMNQQGQQNPQMMQQGQQNPQMIQQGQQNPQMMQQQVQQNPQMMSNQPNQSPSHQQPQSPLINQNASSPMPRSPMVHYQQQQHQNPNSPMHVIDNSPRPNYMQQQQQQQMQQQQQQQGMMDHGNQNQNMMQGGGGGGGNGMHPENPIPYLPEGKVVRIKLGLRGGTPMWSNNGNGNRKQQPSNNAEMLQMIKKAQANTEAQKLAAEKAAAGGETSQQASSSKQMQIKPKTSLLKKPPVSIATSKIKSLVSTDYGDDDSSNGTPPISPLSQKTRIKIQGSKAVEDVVIVDSSPDEKQRMVDYDDDNEKFVTRLTEVSLNSTAQDIGDSDDMIEAFDSNELVSSPLVTEPEAPDYALFETHVVHIDDSDEPLKEIISSNLFDDAMHQEQPKPESSKLVNLANEVLFVIEPDKDEKDPKNLATREDFEAMIDCGKEDDEIETGVVAVEKAIELAAVEPVRKSAEIKTYVATVQEVKKEMKLPTIASTSVSITLPASLISRSSIHTSIAGMQAHNKKLVKNTPPTTAKVSIGNTTISVPVVLKNMPMQNKGPGGDGQQGQKKIMTSSQLNISNLKKNPGLFSMSGQKINTSAIVTLSLNKGTTRPIQTVQRFQQKPGQQTQQIIVPISSCITSSSSSNAMTNIISSVGIVSSVQNSMTNQMTTSRSSPILTFSSKMPTLTMTQDALLPSKIFEDEDILPENDVSEISSKLKAQQPTTSKVTNEFKNVTDDTKSAEIQAEEKPKSLIPVHVIIKSRESSQSPVQNPAQRILSANMSQLSPLSQPIEINTNTHNATQQIRSIMSSINSNEDTKNKSEAEQTSVVSTSQQNIPKTIIRSISTPTTSVNQSGGELRMIVSQQNASVPSSPNVQTSQAGNILLVKQIRAPSSQSVTLPSNTNSTIVVMSQSGQIQSQGSVIISNKPSNLLSILSNQQSTNVQSVKYSEVKMEPPSTTSMDVAGVPKTVTILKTNPTITNLLNAHSYKRSKSTDDAITSKESLEVAAAKRLSLESSGVIKSEPVDQPVVKEVSVISMTEQPQIQKTLNTVVPKPMKTHTSRPENVLLKKLLQSSPVSTVAAPVNISLPLTVSAPVASPVSLAGPVPTTASINVSATSTTPTPVSSAANSDSPTMIENSLNAPSQVRLTAQSSVFTGQRAPCLGLFDSLQAQLARPVVIPPAPEFQMIVSSQQTVTQIPSSSSPVSTPIDSVAKMTSNTKVVSRETSFVSQPQTTPTPTQTPTTSLPISIQSMMEKKPVVVLNRNDIPASLLLSSSNSSNQASKILQTQTSMSFEAVGMAPPNMNVKKEMISPGGSVLTAPSPTNVPTLVKSISQSSLGSGTTTPVPCESPLIDVKKEIMDDSSQSESISSDVSMVKTENLVNTPSTHDSMNDIMDESPAKTAQEIANELKKKKRREYQKNRRQMQMSKEKGLKKPRKLQKSEEDYDSFMDNLMVHIKALPQMQILEPLLPKNFGVCPMYGCSETNKLSSSRRYDITRGELNGVFGDAELPNISDFYNTKPFGGLDAKVEQPPVSTQRGFYDQEFPPIKFEEEDHHRSKYDLLAKDREIDTPETIVTSSSPECVMPAQPRKFPGLKLIREDDEEDEDEIASFVQGRMSPTIPTIIAPVPIRLKSGISLTSDNPLSDKENDSKKEFGVKSCFGPPTPLKDNNNNNVTVTLTLTSSAAEDIMGVLKSLANILNIPAPTAYQIVERTTTPPSQKLGLYRLRGKDGKEGQPVDIQTILNGTAKFCRHCDVVILNNVIKAKANEFPLLVNTELEADELYFCGKICYKQFQWRPINMMDDKNLNVSSEEKGLDALVENVEKPVALADPKVVIELKEMKRKRDEVEDDSEIESHAEKRTKVMKVKTYCGNSFPQIHKQKRLTDREITEMLFRMNVTVNSAPKILEDVRKCIFCHQTGDGVADGPSRLLNYDVDKWVHLNCALWSDGVYETVNGALMNLEPVLQTSLNSQCTICNHLGATIKCFKARCGSIYHLSCAMKDNCVFYKNKTTMCNIHAPKSEKDNELTTLSVQRRVYIERDENRQVASIMHHSDLTNLMRVGSLILLNVGQLLPHQLQAFHTPNYIYPVGYKIIRFFWSMRHPNKRCRYICYIVDVSGRPEFRILVKEVNEEDIELRDETPKKVWQRVLAAIAKLRKEHHLVQVFPKYVSGEDLFGLAEPAIVRILESLPGVETLSDYRFKYGKNPLLELPLAINPSGAARTEPRIKHNVPYKKPHTQRTGSSSQRPAFVPSTSAGDVVCPYSKQFVHSKSSQYKKMKLEWRNNVFLARSKIQGLGLYAARDLEKHTMVIEYIGEVIRGELSELREKQYEAKNRGIYMFRLDEDRVIDATLSGGLARYINHSCNPNCVTEIVEVDREFRIIIFAKRRINRGEELSYDYKFDIEDESRKIACNCATVHCKKWMN